MVPLHCSTFRENIRDGLRLSRYDFPDMLQVTSRPLDQPNQPNQQFCHGLIQYIMQSAANDQKHGLNQQYDYATTGHDPSVHSLLDSQRGVLSQSARSESRPLVTTMETDEGDKCPPRCSCCCHRPSFYSTLELLRLVAGNLFSHHGWLSASASARTACNDRECRQKRTDLLQIKVRCPTWFAQINADVRMKCIPMHVCIQTPRAVRSLLWLQDATLEQVTKKLSCRELTLSDVESDGESVLHVSRSILYVSLTLTIIRSRVLTWRLTADRSDTTLSILAFVLDHSAPTEWEWKGL